jgi:hypothetical protein
LWAEALAEAPQVQALAKYAVIPNPSPVVHEGCRSGGRPPVGLITLTASTDIDNQCRQHKIFNEIKIPGLISCQGTEVSFLRRFRRIENQNFLDRKSTYYIMNLNNYFKNGGGAGKK